MSRSDQIKKIIIYGYEIVKNLKMAIESEKRILSNPDFPEHQKVFHKQYMKDWKESIEFQRKQIKYFKSLLK